MGCFANAIKCVVSVLGECPPHTKKTCTQCKCMRIFFFFLVDEACIEPFDEDDIKLE